MSTAQLDAFTTSAHFFVSAAISCANSAGVLMSLSKTDEVLYLGEEKNGFAKVTSPNGDGWVKVVLLRKP